MPGRQLKRVLFPVYLAACLVFIPELFFRFVIPAAEAPLGHFDTAESIYRYSPGDAGVYTFGRFSEYRCRWRINNYGWNSPVDYREKKDKIRIAVIGDSFVEALHVDAGKSYPFRLQEMLGSKYEVYAFGMSAAPLSEYLHISRYVDRHFDPDILVFNIIYNDFVDSILRYNKHYSRVFLTVSVDGSAVKENSPGADRGYAEFSAGKRFLRRHSAFARYLIFNLKLRMYYRELADKDFTWHRGMEFWLSDDQKRDIMTAGRYILGRIKAENAGRKVIFVMDAPRQAIYRGEPMDRQTEWLHELLGRLCHENNFYFLDLTVPMRSDYAKKRIRFNTPAENHWDEYGHRFVAEKIYEMISAL